MKELVMFQVLCFVNDSMSSDVEIRDYELSFTVLWGVRFFFLLISIKNVVFIFIKVIYRSHCFLIVNLSATTDILKHNCSLCKIKRTL